MTNETLGARIRARREELGFTQADLASRVRRLGFQFSQQAIGKIERDGTARPKGLHELCRALGLNPGWALSGRGERLAAPPQSASAGPVMVVGAAEAGVWRDGCWQWPEAEHVASPIVVPAQCKHHNQFALAVRDDSMDAVYPAGSIVACIPAPELNRPIRAGERVVVVRQSEQGVETTIRELGFAPNGSAWLWPRSSNPAHQDPWRVDVAEAVNRPVDSLSADSALRIVAVVVGAFLAEPVLIYPPFSSSRGIS